MYALRNAVVKPWPFPHFYAERVFPEDFYWSVVDFVKNKTEGEYRSGVNNYNGRKFALSSDIPGLGFMQSGDFLRHVAKIFREPMRERFGGREGVKFGNDLRLIRDGKDYFIGPHTDTPQKVISLLFYLPPDGWNYECGTSLYLPKERDYRCAGGPHYPFELFDRIETMPFLPNTCFGFFKTDYSFHGVEKLDRDIQRNVLLYNVYDLTLGSELAE